MVPHFCKSYKRQNYLGRFGIGEQLEVPLHAVRGQVFQRPELQLLEDVGGGHLDIILGALFFDEADQIFYILVVVSVLFQVPAPKNHC